MYAGNRRQQTQSGKAAERKRIMAADQIFINACKNAQKGVVQAFLKKGGIDLDKRDQAGCTALYYAAAKGTRDIVRLLLDAGADPGLANNQSAVPLHSVSQSGNKEIIRMLVEHGADINATDKRGRTPLVCSAMEGKTEASLLLLELGADQIGRAHV